MRGKKSARAVSPLEEVTVESTLVSSMDKTTAPLANLAILPVSRVTRRLPISNSSVKVSRNFVADPPLPEEMVRRKATWRRNVWRSGFALLIHNAMDIGITEKIDQYNSGGTYSTTSLL